jgi:hypothetical protein
VFLFRGFQPSTAGPKSGSAPRSSLSKRKFALCEMGTIAAVVGPVGFNSALDPTAASAILLAPGLRAISPYDTVLGASTGLPSTLCMASSTKACTVPSSGEKLS